jgi:hypothetical protein
MLIKLMCTILFPLLLGKALRQIQAVSEQFPPLILTNPSSL